MEQKNITAYQSVTIDKQLKELKNIIDNHDDYFYNKNPKEKLLLMFSELENEIDWIKEFIED